MPRTLPRSSALANFRADPISFLLNAAAVSGPTAEFKLGRRRLTLLLDPHLIEELLVKRQRSLRKGPGLLRLKPVLGDGLLTADDDRHSRNRRHIQPAFSVGNITDYGSQMPAIAARCIENWRPGDNLDIHKEMARMTLNIVSATLFRSSTVPDHAIVGSAIAHNLDALYRPLMRCPQTGRNTNSEAAALNGVISKLSDGHCPAVDNDDLWTLLNDGTMSEVERGDEAVTFLLGGHESVATALAWAWFALARNPLVRKLYETEIDQRDPASSSPDQYPYTKMVVAETLRLYPPAWFFTREATESITIGDEQYPKGSLFAVAPFVTHRDSRYWDNPESFLPERWSENSISNSTRPRYAYFPFGAGARRCIGEQFALTEMVMTLAAIGRLYRLDYPDNAPAPRFDPIVTLRPEDGLTMRVTSRRQAEYGLGLPAGG